MTITKFIKDDLIARIFSSSEQDESLTLGGIASHYSVSITPVRAAVQELVAEGILQKGENRRLGVNRDRLNERVATSPEIKNPKAKNVDPLQSHIQEISDYTVRLSIEGEPVFLREESTAKRFGISRSAVRQIFSGLAGHGMLQHIPRRGWQIRPLREKDLDEYIEVRIAMELQALKLARPHLVDKDIRNLLDRNRLPATPTDEPLCDDSLHQYISQKADNRYIANFFEQNSKYFSLLFDWEALDRETKIQTVRQHRDILEAILCKDWSLAESALQFHIRHNHPLLRKRMRERFSSGSQAVEH
ncbi:MAG: GntR family transcriptional regulator [Planctomycetes bacterium]|nr:GntR family transcriptional regulator [Planctomycetota bacterium]